MKRFNKKLLGHIKFDRHKQAKFLIKMADLARTSDDWGTLLHYAAKWNNERTIDDLIKMGSEVNCRNSESKTALIVAVIENCYNAVAALLKANASVEIVDAEGKTALHYLFTSMPEGFSSYFELFIEKFERDALTIAETAERLANAGMTIKEACFIDPKRRIEVMTGLFERGIDVNLTVLGKNHCPALDHAIALRDLELAKWLIDHGADIHSVNQRGNCPLSFAVFKGNVEMVSLLLEHGANPNVDIGQGTSILCIALFKLNVEMVGLLLEHAANPNAEYYMGYTPLDMCLTFKNTGGDWLDNYYKCMELLFEHGAIFQNSRIDDTALLDWALSHESPEIMKMLIAYLAILDKKGIPIAKTIMYDDLKDHPEMLDKLQKDYEKYKEILESTVYGELKLFDLLTKSKDKMRILVRNESLIKQIKRINPRLGKSYPWYFKLLKKRTTKATELVKLEDQAIPVLCKLLKQSHKQCYTFIREVVGYLNERDLQQLSQV